MMMMVGTMRVAIHRDITVLAQNSHQILFLCQYLSTLKAGRLGAEEGLKGRMVTCGSIYEPRSTFHVLTKNPTEIGPPLQKMTRVDQL